MLARWEKVTSFNGTLPGSHCAPHPSISDTSMWDKSIMCLCDNCDMFGCLRANWRMTVSKYAKASNGQHVNATKHRKETSCDWRLYVGDWKRKEYWLPVEAHLKIGGMLGAGEFSDCFPLLGHHLQHLKCRGARTEWTKCSPSPQGGVRVVEKNWWSHLLYLPI